MGEAYIVDAVRAPDGRRRGGLAGIHPADLGAHPIRALVERTGVDPAAIEDVIYGCIDAIGAQPVTSRGRRRWSRACPSMCPA